MRRNVAWARRLNWWSVGGMGLAIVGFAWVASRVEFASLGKAIAGADAGYLLLVPVAVIAEQVVRAWKWRQILEPRCRPATSRLFGAIMAGYLASFLVPFGASPLVRSWLVARLQGLAVSSVLATVAIDRLVDGFVFAGIVALVAMVAVLPDADESIRLGLTIGALGSLLLLTLILVVLAHHKRQIAAEVGWLVRLADRLPRRFSARTRALLISFADGIVWPREGWRRVAIVLASVLIKLIAASHFLWAGLAFGILLPALDYLFLLAFLGFLVFIAHVARVPGSFILGGVFALSLLGVSEEHALAMVAVVVASTLLAIGLVGAFTLWRHGVALGELRSREIAGDGPA